MLRYCEPQTLQKMLQRLDDFITSAKPKERPYFYSVVRSFAQARGEALDAAALGVAARLDSANDSYVRGSAADALGRIAADKAENFAAGLMLALNKKKKSARRKAAEVVGYYVKEPCLTELERLAATDESDEVKEAARAAVEKAKYKLRYFDTDAAL